MEEILESTSLRDGRIVTRTSVSSDDPSPSVSTSNDSKGRRVKRAASSCESRKKAKLDRDSSEKMKSPVDEKERLIVLVKKYAKSMENLVDDAEEGRRSMVEALKRDTGGFKADRGCMKVPKLEMLELPNHHNPWLEPVAPSRSASQDALAEIDYIPATYILGRSVDTPCGPGCELPSVSKFPSYYAWSALPHNDFVEDEKELSDLPHGEELTDKFIKEYKKHFPHTAMEVEMRRTRNLLLTQKHMVEFIVEINDEAKKILENGDSSTSHNIDMKIFQAVSEAFNGIESPEGVMHRYYRAIGEPKHSFLQNLNTDTGNAPTVSRFLDSCSRLMCIRCFRYDCLEHPYQASRGPTIFSISPPNLARDACGPDCHMVKDEKESAPVRPITLAEKAILKTFLTEEEEAAYTYCQLAAVINRSCRATCEDIRFLLLELDPEETKDSCSPVRSRPKSRQRSGATTKRRMSKDWQKEGDHKKFQYIPCNHGPGFPCNDGEYCTCVDRGHKCERFCACDAECRNKQFCRCTGMCQTKQCPCFIQRRECDPELCGCQAKMAKEGCCKNTAILFNSKKKVKCGASDVHGWGAFIMEPAKSGEFISEYTGEVISQEEAERRGRLYDQVTKVSYLFDLNLEFVVDAARKGNKIRYANHSKLSANCYPEIYRVQGENRIGIFAKRDLAAGEELFFDYSYTGDSLKFVQIEPSKGGGPSSGYTDFRVACIAKNIESRPAKPKKKILENPGPAPEVIKKTVFRESVANVRLVEAVVTLRNDGEEDESDNILTQIQKALETADTMILQPFCGSKPVLDSDERDVAYRKAFPCFEEVNDDFPLDKLWQTLGGIALSAETFAGRTVKGIVLDSSASSSPSSNGSKSSGSNGNHAGTSTRVKKEPMDRR